MQKSLFPGQISLATLAILFGLSLALAGPPTGALSGVVVNGAGAPVAAAQVSWQAADGTAPHALHTDARGHFEMAALRPGLYEVRAEAAGKWSDWEHNVLVRPGGSASVTLRLVRTTPPSLAAAAHTIKGLVREWTVPVEDSLPHDPAVDAQDHVWVTLMQANQLGRFDPDTGRWKFFSVPAQNAGPHGLVADAQGNIWFTENSAGKIGRLDPQSGVVTEFAVAGVKDPHTPVFGPDGALWFTAQNANSITRMNTNTGEMKSFAVPTAAAMPYGIVVGPDGALWFCEFGANKIGRLDPATGSIAEFVAPEENARPRRLAVDGQAIYFTDFAGGRLGRLDVATGKFRSWPSPSGATSQPYGMAVDRQGLVWFCEAGANKLVRFDPQSEKFETFPMASANSYVRNIARDSRGRLWLALSGANKIAVVQ
jgi:virginiamycin B lyase